MDPEAIRHATQARVDIEREKYAPAPEAEPGKIDDAGPIITSEEIIDSAYRDEDGNADIFIKCHANNYRFDRSSGDWFEWRVHHWGLDVLGNAMRLGIEEVIPLYTSEASRQAWNRAKAEQQNNEDLAKKHEKSERACLRQARKLHNISRKRNVLELAGTGNNSLGIRGDEWDRDPMVLGVKNGVVDLSTSTLRPGRPEDLIKTVSPVEYQGPNMPCPVFSKTLHEIFSDCVPIIEYFQRLCGYCLTGLTDEHVFVILWGSGRNGKSLLLSIITYILGDHAGEVEAEFIMKQKFGRHSGGPTSDIMAMQGKRLIVASESPDGAQLNAGRVKWTTGGDRLTGRAVYGKRQVSFSPTHKLWLLTNHRPHIDPGDYALIKRLHLIPFQRAFVENPDPAKGESKADPRLFEKMKVESSGILAWMVRGCLEWQRQGLNPPNEVRAAVESYVQEEDVIKLFLDEVCQVGPGLTVKAGDLYKAYDSWCQDNHIRPLNGTRFGKEIKGRFDSVKTNVVSYLGVSLV